MAVIIGGKDIRNTPEQVSKNTLDIEELKSRDYTYKSDIIDNLSSYQTKKPLSANQGRILKQMLNDAIAGVFHYKGSVATFDDLPSSGMEIGDTYNVLDTGNNFTWDGTGWDQLSGLVDLSAYYTKTESDAKYVDLTTAQEISGEKTLSAPLNIPASSANTNYQIACNNGYYLDIKYGTTTALTIQYESILNTRSLKPLANNAYDLGASTMAYKDLYLSGKAYLGSSGTTYITTDAYNGLDLKVEGQSKLVIRAGQTYINNDFMPLTVGTRDLGSSTYTWKDFYLGGDIYLANEMSIKASGANNRYIIRYNAGNGIVDTNFSFCPTGTGDNLNLGISYRQWKDLYLSGNLSNGTDTATIADIAALITYAKAQGWIS